MKNFALLILSLLLASIFFPIGVLVTLINAAREGSWSKVVGYLSKSALSLALAIDTMANTICRDLLNGWMRKQEGGYEFGNYKETISKVLGKNKQSGTLTDAGRALSNLLNWIDKGHVERAAND